MKIEPMVMENWNTPVWDKIKISVYVLDEVGLPFERRSMTVDVPKPDQRGEFSANAGQIVEVTLKDILGGAE